MSDGAPPPPTEPEPEPTGWFNRTVLGAGLTSFLADVGYEMAGAVLPNFLGALGVQAVGGLVGLIEGTADAVSNFVKLGVGWHSDRLARRKPLVVLGYAVTGAANGLYALAAGWPLVFLAKVAAWVGKGVRGPLRNAILADAVAPADRGKAFGLHRAGDTVGAVLGPLLAFAVLWSAGPALASTEGDPTAAYRLIFLLALVPGLGSALAFALMIRERPRPANPALRFGASLRAMPRPFRRFLVGVGVFGLGDFTDKLLIVAAAALLAPAEGPARAAALAAALYAWRNTCQAAVAFPIGWLGDRFGRRGLLALGYLVGAGMMAGFGLAFFAGTTGLPALAGLFALGGVYLAAEETLEAALTADLVPDRALRGTAFGLMATVNGLGDFVSSVAAGLLFDLASPAWAFGSAAALMLLGAGLLQRVR
jgi:MFS family permease